MSSQKSPTSRSKSFENMCKVPHPSDRIPLFPFERSHKQRAIDKYREKGKRRVYGRIIYSAKSKANYFRKRENGRFVKTTPATPTPTVTNKTKTPPTQLPVENNRLIQSLKDNCPDILIGSWSVSGVEKPINESVPSEDGSLYQHPSVKVDQDNDLQNFISFLIPN
mmetsp:Transcript_27681/g.44291  ORF Transcript_27681/g.44291 Transcript_27681/m.44291 type:complete len:166 (-) Transcript_27681:228-725(-)